MKYGTPGKIFRQLADEFDLATVYTNQDYEPYAKERDEGVKKLLDDYGIGFKTFKDQVIFEKDEVVKENGAPYTIFTPYSKKWKGSSSMQKVLRIIPQSNFWTDYLS